MFAKLGRKAGASRSLGYLPNVADLPGEGWRLLDESTWRTGWMLDKSSERAVRARKIKSVSAARSFEQYVSSVGVLGGLSVQVAPYATEEDALDVLSRPKNVTSNPRSKVRKTDERSVDWIRVEGSPSIWAYEMETLGPKGEGVARHLMGTAGRIVFGLTAAGSSEMWSWEEVVSLAESIVLRISHLPE